MIALIRKTEIVNSTSHSCLSCWTTAWKIVKGRSTCCEKHRDDVVNSLGMPYRQLALSVLILGSILVKAYLAVTLDGVTLADHVGQSQRTLLQSAATDWETCEAVIEYDPAFDDPLELQSLTALYEATGGNHWTYGSHFQTASTAVSQYSAANETAQEALIQRFNRTAWLDVSVSYCQW